MRRRKLSLGGNGAEYDSAKSKLGNKCFHGKKRHLSILIMHINAKGELHTYRTRGTGLKVLPTNEMIVTLRADLHGTIFVACDNGLRQAHDMIYCCVRQKKCRSILKHVLGPIYTVRFL